MEIELTSCRDDGNWTWRAVGAREPRGVVEGVLLPDEVSPGDYFRVETEQDVDGILVTAILPDRATRGEPERLEILGSGQKQPEVTTTLLQGKRRRRGNEFLDDDHQKPRRNTRGGGRSSASTSTTQSWQSKTRTDSKASTPRRKPGGRNGRDKSQPGSTVKPKKSTPPRSRRLRPKRKHRKAALAELPAEQQRVAEIVLRSGMPGLRDAIATQNALARDNGQPEIPADILLHLAERIHPVLRTADWLDRAEAAADGVDQVDLGELRSVVVASGSVSRNDQTRSLADQLGKALTERVNREHSAWLGEVAKAIDEGRGIRALRLSSRPPKAGAPLPESILVRLTEMANNDLSSDINQGRWATLLDAVALSPVHARVLPTGLPEKPSQDLLDLVRRIGVQVPQIATLFGIEPSSPPRRRSSRGRTKT